MIINGRIHPIIMRSINESLAKIRRYSPTTNSPILFYKSAHKLRTQDTPNKRTMSIRRNF